MIFTMVALIMGSVLLMVASTLTVNAPTYVPIARTDLSTVEASLRHATLNALAGYVNKKHTDINVALSQNLDALDKRLVPWSSYTVLSYSPMSTSSHWSEASLSVKYTIETGKRSLNYTCNVKLSGFVLFTAKEGVYYVVAARLCNEYGTIVNPNLIFDPKPIKMVVESDAFKLYYLQRPSTIEVVDERGLRVYLTP